MIDDFFKNNNIDPETVLIGGAPDVDEQQRESIFELLKEYGVSTNKWLETGAIISSHGGPGAVGITGIEKTP